MTDKRAFVLLSGGIDSTTCLHKAILDFAPSAEVGDHILSDAFDGPVDGGATWVEAVSVDYGQRHRKEAEYAAATCRKFGIKHSVLRIGDVLAGKGVMLADAAVPIPSISYDEIRGVSPTYVPFRNGTMLSLIAAHAQKWVDERIDDATENAFGGDRLRATDYMRDSAGIYFGAHAEDAANWAYPDCTPEFIGAMANAIYVGTYSCVRLYAPIQWMGKAEIIRLGESLGVDWAGTWSCYAGGELHCGECPTCRARRAGFEAAGVADPTVYLRVAA